MAEDSVSDYFRLSEGFWCRHPFEVRTLAELAPTEVTHEALAQGVAFTQGWTRAG